MPHCQVYIGELEDPDLYFRWNAIGAYYQRGAMPRLISEISPPVWRSAGEAFDALVDGIESGTLIGEQIGPGCWVAVVTAQEIMDFINGLYGEKRGGLLPLRRKMAAGRIGKVVVLLRRLDSGKNYALVGRRL
ncbi:MAG: hypothetical protein P4N41_00785 [Negativicutes bacterium]|nr:hypothetical protein [Negativicutes bacterium]